MIDNIKVGRTIAGLRQNRGMTQQQLAATLNVSHQAVSKWETGAALPDVQTLMSLTRLFGITMEQLLNGEVPEDRTAPAEKSALEESLESVGNAVNSFMSGLFAGATKPAEAQSEEDDEAPKEPLEEGAEDAGATDRSADESIDDEENAAHEDAGEADGSAEEAADPENPPEEEPFDLQELLRMAPFMSKQAVGELLLEHKSQLSTLDIARFAPFITRECLEELIQNPEAEITWETLRRIAPFLKREMVDRLTRAAAKGEKLVREATEQGCKSPEDLGRSIGEMSQRIGSGVEKALRRAARMGEDAMNEAGKAINEMLEGLKSREDRASALRRAAMERAIQDEKWDWIAAHIDDLNDEELKRTVAQKANAAGMHDWVLEHLNGYVDTSAIDAAIEGGNWGWLGEHVWQFEPELQQRIALAAAREGNWLWLTGYAEMVDLGDVAAQVARVAYEAGEKLLARSLAGQMSAEQREIFANDIVAAEDDDFLETLAEVMDGGYFGRLCLARAQTGNWEGALRFVEHANQNVVEQLMELAIAEGNFDAIDRLNPIL